MQIRQAQEEDLDGLVALWYEASCRAHDFIAAAYWEANKDAMRHLYLPLSQNWIIGACDGFLSLMGNEVNALFISPGQEGKGLGTALLERAKRDRDTLFLNVYARNASAVRFYEKRGFSVIATDVDEAVDEKQLRMRWTREDPW